MNVKKYMRFIGAVVAVLFMAGKCAWGYPDLGTGIRGQVFPGDDVRNRVLSEQELRSPWQVGDASVVTLEDPEVSAPRRYLRVPDSPRRKIGAARFLEQLHDFERFQRIVDWQRGEDGGHTAVFFISSPQAKALRAGMIFNDLPVETEFRFFSAFDEEDHILPVLITGEQILRLLTRNMAADYDHPDVQTFWSPVVPGNRMGIEIYLPPGIDPDRPDMAIPFVSHIDRSLHRSDSEFSIPQKYGESNPCQNDAACYSEWVDQKNAVAKMVFTENGDSYTCTGTLLNDSDDFTWIPYFITANHCIRSQTVASTLETHWFFESDACNSILRDPDYTVSYGGADLLWTRGYTASAHDGNQDVTFLRLNDAPPAGAVFAGWHTAAGTDPVIGIHHPAGDWKKISFGNPSGRQTCYATGDDGYECIFSVSGSFLDVVWTDGGTETGSSGSGLFNMDGQLVATLLGGSGGDCAGSQSDYSTFGAAFTAGNLSQWLDPVHDPVFGTVVLSGSRPGITLPAGSDAVIYGTAAPNHIILESGARAVLINFPGPNTLEIRSNPDLFTVSRSGTVVTFQGPDNTTLKIPATTDEQTIVFNDKDPFKLRIHQGRVMLDDRVIFTTGRTIYAK